MPGLRPGATCRPFHAADHQLVLPNSRNLRPSATVDGSSEAAILGKRGADGDEDEEEHLAKKSRDNLHSQGIDDEGINVLGDWSILFENDVSEVYSRPRLIKRAAKWKLKGGVGARYLNMPGNWRTLGF